MTNIVYSPGALVGDRPLNLNPVFRHESDGSIASQLEASGYYAGVIAAQRVLETFFADQPEILAQLGDIFTDPTVSLEGGVS